MSRRVDYHDERAEMPIWRLITQDARDKLLKLQEKRHPEELLDLSDPDLPDVRYNPKPENVDSILKLISRRPYYGKGVGWK